MFMALEKEKGFLFIFAANHPLIPFIIEKNKTFVSPKAKASLLSLISIIFSEDKWSA